MPGAKIEKHSPQALLGSKSLGPAYGLCPETGLLYYLKASPSAHYSDEYFGEQYKKQYGCSYLEDEQRLRFVARRRLGLLQRYLKPGAKILEIGSAFGFFLDEAKKAGYESRGLELSPKWSCLCKREIPA